MESGTVSFTCLLKHNLVQNLAGQLSSLAFSEMVSGTQMKPILKYSQYSQHQQRLIWYPSHNRLHEIFTSLVLELSGQEPAMLLCQLLSLGIIISGDSRGASCNLPQVLWAWKTIYGETGLPVVIKIGGLGTVRLESIKAIACILSA